MTCSARVQTRADKRVGSKSDHHWNHYVNCKQSLRLPRGSIYTTIMELGPQSYDEDGLLGPTSTMVVYMDPKP